MDTTLLKQAGLTDGEARAYLALLGLGPSTTGPIVKQSGITKSIIYRILYRLEQKGLVSHVVKEKTMHYQAASPSSLLEYIEKREAELGESRKRMEEYLPKLLDMQKTAKASEAQVYFGFRGMISAHENTYLRLSKGEEYFYLGVPQEQPKHYHAYWQRDHMRRVKAGIKCRLLFHPKTGGKVLENRNAYPGCDARYMPLEINTPVWIMGYKDVTMISMVSSDPITVEIVNQEIANSFRKYFEEFWEQSRKQK
ncbi:MAG: hypothetical protein NT051_06030 [Candidatus Micrarchaeota archaeon]|nr:hypothetical protein [Candidatus Micrarchaeota archaeon]